MLSDIKIPRCPGCQADAMFHRCVSHVQERAGFKKNGWYCERCHAGPYQLGTMTEAKAAETAKTLLGRSDKANIYWLWVFPNGGLPVAK